MSMTTSLQDGANDIARELIADRRHLHQHPELAWHEEETAQYVAERLRALGLEVETGVGGTGVVGLLRGDQSGNTVLLRADMDALPIEEQNNVTYRSQNLGVMHACGHDAHTAMLLGAARLLGKHRSEIPGMVKFVFQPAEEVPPGGAQAMIKSGVLETPRVDAAFGVHIGQDMPLGTVGVTTGPMNAASDRFEVTIAGQGGHAARPHLSVDPVVIASHCILGLQTLVSREVDPLKQVVVTIGALHAGTIANVIPETATLAGTVRTFSPDVRQYIAERIPALIDGIAHAMRATADTRYDFGYPALVNDEAMTDLVREVARDVVGERGVVERQPSMGGEDMAYFLRQVPGSFFRIGSNNPDRRLTYGHHHPRFDIDEAALPVGTAMLASVAVQYLNQSRAYPRTPAVTSR